MNTKRIVLAWLKLLINTIYRWNKIRSILKYIIFGSIFYAISSTLIGVAKHFEDINNIYDFAFFVIFKTLPIIIFSSSITIIIFDRLKKILKKDGNLI